MMSGAGLMFFALSLAVSFVGTAYMAFWTWRYSIARMSMAIHVRHPRLALGCQMFLLGFVGLQRPLASAVWTLQAPASISQFLRPAAEFLFGVFYFGAVLLVCWRVFLLNFDMTVYRQEMGVRWEYLVNKGEDAGANRVQERLKTHGDFYWVGKRVLALYIACALLYTAVFATSHSRYSYVPEFAMVMLTTTVLAMYLVVLWNQLPHDDLTYLYKVKDELKWVLYALLFGWGVAVFSIPAGSNPRQLLWRVLFDVGPTLVAVCVSLSQSQYVLQVNGIKGRVTKRMVKREKVDPMFRKEKARFTEAMQDPTTFKLYVAHLNKEFSIENLIAAMEFRQLAGLVLSADIWDSDKDKISRSKFLARHDHDFYRRCPPSQIVMAEDVLFEARIAQMYQKYIGSNSSLQLNLPSALTSSWELFHISFCSELQWDPNEDVTSKVYELALDLKEQMQAMSTPGGDEDFHVTPGGREHAQSRGIGRGGFTPGRKPMADDRGADDICLDESDDDEKKQDEDFLAHAGDRRGDALAMRQMEGSSGMMLSLGSATMSTSGHSLVTGGSHKKTPKGPQSSSHRTPKGPKTGFTSSTPKGGPLSAQSGAGSGGMTPGMDGGMGDWKLGWEWFGDGYDGDGGDMMSDAKVNEDGFIEEESESFNQEEEDKFELQIQMACIASFEEEVARYEAVRMEGLGRARIKEWRKREEEKEALAPKPVDEATALEYEKQYYLHILTLIDMTISECYKLMLDSYTRFNEAEMEAEQITAKLKIRER